MKEKVFALVDCNNFFVSCERIFDPKLRNVPVMVLSNNDGCVVARSNEVKQLGIRMAQPYFECLELVQRHDIKVLSSNFALYADMSRRVIEVLREFTPEIEVYSVDESFLNLGNLVVDDFNIYGQEIRERIQKCLGLPVSIGIAKTKTLAKVSNRIAKKDRGFNGVCDFTSLDERQINNQLSKFSVSDIWGIGHQTTKLLNKKGITTALQLKYSGPKWARKRIKLVGERIVMELNGVSCLSLENVRPPKKSIASTRSFGRYIITLEELEESITMHASQVAEKLRKQKSVANFVVVFIRTNKYNLNLKQYHIWTTLNLPNSTSYTPEIIKYALAALRSIYKHGYKYKKAGVVVIGIEPEDRVQFDAFDDRFLSTNLAKRKTLMTAFDSINRKWGSRTIFIAKQGIKQPWKMIQDKKSPRYTTQWLEIPPVNV